MKKITIILFAIVIFIVSFFIFSQNRPIGQKTAGSNLADQQTNAGQKWASKTDDQSAITVTVTPIDILSQSEEWKFDIAMDNHSVELSQDLAKSSVFVDDQGKEYQPLRWEGPVGGHHREGLLIFSRITPTPKSIGLRISGIGDIVRSFTWQLK